MLSQNLKTAGMIVLAGMIGVAIAAAPGGEPKSDKEPVQAPVAAPAKKPAAALASFAVLDKDGDAALARSEIPADDALSARFTTYDLDKDTALSEDEYDRYLANAADDLFDEDM